MKDKESSPVFKPNGLITLTTDFGLSDPYVGILKGVIVSRYPAAQLVDLSHHVPAFKPKVAGFWLSHASAYFSSGTVHLAVVDPGVGTARAMVCLQAGGQLFIAPDNGLLDEVYLRATQPRWQVFTLDDLGFLQLPEASHTFHGRDIFAPLVAEIAAGRISTNSLGKVICPSLTRDNHGASNSILWADHYGNLITDVPADHLARFRQPALQWRDRVIRLATSYGFAVPGTLLAVVNSWGTLEIATVQGSAQQTLQAMAGETISLIETAPPRP